jgi:hypothetical protein
MVGVIAKRVARRQERLWVRFDRTEFRHYRAPTAAAGIYGRSVPMLRAGDPEWKLPRSQTRSPLSPGPPLSLTSPTGRKQYGGNLGIALIPEHTSWRHWPGGAGAQPQIMASPGAASSGRRDDRAPRRGDGWAAQRLAPPL